MAAAVAFADVQDAATSSAGPDSSGVPVAVPVDLSTLDIQNGSNGSDAPDDASLATQFGADGYCVAPGIVDASQLDECRAAALDALDECKARDPTMGVGQKCGYREIVQRMPGRYELRHGLDKAPLVALRRRVEASRAFAAARRILQNEMRVLGCSVVIADEDCAAQAWHVDGAHMSPSSHSPPHVLNIFVPLVDVTKGGGTEIKPGSHFLTRNLTKQMLLARIKKTLRSPLVPLVSPGDALLFDYRVLHRGTLNNTGGPRPVFVVTVAKPWFRDLVNFPKRALFPDDGGA